ncbi:MAG: hypothetical protein RIE73_02790 [Coleofasciculus sp. C1-SOL-03]|uniref:hypothetical protein n=1 Tax=Coleofasciculus sp. C1-SOL-03 TaxID=3069522 RepID=UPI0033002EEC
MTTAVQVAIAGEAAEPAVSELMAMPGLSVYALVTSFLTIHKSYGVWVGEQCLI